MPSSPPAAQPFPTPPKQDPAAKVWESYNDFLMWGDVGRYAKFLVRYELFKKTMELPGDIVEGGVFKGAGVLFWAKLIQLFHPQSTKKVIGFDTFDGYVDTGNTTDAAAGSKFIQESNYRGVSPESIMEMARQQGLAHRIELVKGDATKTVFEYARQRPGFRICLLNFDYDVAEPTRAGLEALYPRVVPGGLVVFDEYAIHAWSESDAADEFLKGKNLTLKAVPWAGTPSAYVEKREM